MQGEIQVDMISCKVADDPVVVMKFRPVKAGNSVEDKTEMTQHLVVEGL